MAGIGFELNRILTRRGYTAVLHAYTYAGLVGSGPWIIAVVCLGFLGTTLARMTGQDQARLFLVAVSVVYAVTLILSGPLQLVLTRFAADQFFSGKQATIVPAYLQVLAFATLAFSVVGGLLFGLGVPGDPAFRFAGALLTVLVAGIWITGVFLTAAKNYRLVLFGFAGGFAVSLVAGWWAGARWGATGALLGFTGGHAILLVWLFATTLRELGGFAWTRSDFWSYFPRFWDLALIGFFYNLAIWIDKFLFWWFDPAAEKVAGILHASTIYDRVVYFSFLTIIPGMAVFLLKLETQFAAQHERFYRLVLHKGTLRQIADCKLRMVQVVREGLIQLFKVQGLVTLGLMVLADRALDLLQLGSVQSGVFRLSLIGAFLLVVFLALLMILFYLDKRRDALACCVLFCLLSGTITAWTILAGERWFAVGFVVAAAASVALAATRVARHLERLEYDTFSSQPLYG
jgi:uncharacterized membrane protein